MGKHFRIEITDESLRCARDRAAIAAEAALDGIYVLRTSVPAAQLPTDDTVRADKQLATVERVFRIIKSVDLKTRPIHHRLADRVRAQVLLCMLVYYVEWHMRRTLAPLLFDDDRTADGAPCTASRCCSAILPPSRRTAAVEARCAPRG